MELNPSNSNPSPPPRSDTWVYVLVVCAAVAAVGMLIQARQVTADAAPAAKTRAAGRAASSFTEIRRLAAGVDEPRALALAPDGRLYVGGNRSIRRFRADGNASSAIPVQCAVRCLAVDRDGRIYAGANNRVEVIEASGGPAVLWKSFDPSSVVTSISLTGDDVWVADAGRKTVWRCNRRGQVIGRFAEKDKARDIPGLVIPSPYFDLAMGPDGFLRVANPGRHRIEIYAMDGTLVSWWGQPSAADDGFAGCCNPTDIAVLPDGRVVTSEKKLPRVKVSSRDGRFLGMMAAADAFEPQTAGMDLAVDRTGRIYLLDPVRREIRIYGEAHP